MTKIIITGASGVLGSAIYDAFKSAPDQFDVIGLAHSRVSGELQHLDLLDEKKLENAFISEFAVRDGDWVIHCAAERRPVVAEKNSSRSKKLNVTVSAHLARLSAKQGFTLVYISTDYVFDGTSPPHSPKDRTNPLQLYGRNKRDGENAILDVKDAKGVVIRVPVLYGPASANSEFPINILLDIVQDQSGKTYNMDHFGTRYPTNVLDIGAFLVRLKGLNKPLPAILHYSAGEPFTKYEICLVFAKILGLPHEHIIPQPNAPTDGTPRPANTQLDVRETEALFEGSGFEGLGWSEFEEWWTGYLGGKPSKST